MITKYDNFINEHISFVNKEYTKIIYQLFEKNGYGKYTINLKNNRLKLLNCTICFENNGGLKKCYFDESNVYIEDLFGNLVMSNAYLYFSNFDISTFMEDISHEIGHMQERYDKLLDKSLNKNGESTHNIINYTIQKMRNKNTYFDVFLDIIYRTTDNELNSKMNEIYFYLKKYDTIDMNLLKKELLDCIPYKTIKEIESLDFINLSYGLINKAGVSDLTMYINEFNTLYFSELKKNNTRNIKTYNFLKNKIYSDNDIINYFTTWENIIKKKFEKFHNKLKKIISQVISDIHFDESYININCDDKLIERINNIINYEK